MCLAHGRETPATHVDHKIPHKGDQELFWDKANWQALCETCHNSHKQRIERNGYDHAVGNDGWPTDPNHPANRGWRGEVKSLQLPFRDRRVLTSVLGRNSKVDPGNEA